MINNKIKAVIFDLDGTLLDTLDDLSASVNYALLSNNLPRRRKEEVKSFVGNGIRKLIERSVPQNTDKILTDKVFDTFNSYYAQHCNDKTHVYYGLENVLKKLKSRGIKLAVVSNKSDYATTVLCREYFGELLEAAVGVRENVRKKPYPDSVFEVMNVMNVSKEETLFVGDSEVDIQTAKNAGIKCISVAWGFKTEDFLKQNGAEKIVFSSVELEKELLEEE